MVGIREAAIALAGLMGDNIAVITTRKFSVAQYKRVLKGKVHEVTCLDIPVLELGDYERVYKTLDERVGQVAAKGSDIVVLGCGSILNLDFHSIEEKYGIPIVLPVYAGVIACEFMVRTGLKQSRIAYPIPDEKEFR